MCVSYEDAHVVDEKEEGRMVDDHCEIYRIYTIEIFLKKVFSEKSMIRLIILTMIEISYSTF